MQQPHSTNEEAAIGDPEPLVTYAQRLCEDRLAAYSAAPHDAEEHANIETSVLAGGYAYRQVAELVQNAADAISEMSASGAGPGRIVIEADARGLWAANTGAPIDRAGIRALLNAHSSNKRGGQIGRFGLGFKSLLRFGGRIDVLSRSVCLRFNPENCRSRIRVHLNIPANAPAPGLRLADACTWAAGTKAVPGAEEFGWATTIVFAELVAADARNAVTEEIRSFPAEFLLFLPCDAELVLKASDVSRHLRRNTSPDGTIVIEDLASEKPAAQSWRVFETAVQIRSKAALDDATSVHARESVPLIWAAPVGGGREAAGRFYAFFPTSTETRTLGILNAPWKLNSDRTAVIPGAWNSALMEAAAELVVSRLPELATDEDPGIVLDAFPRELQSQTEPAAPLVGALWTGLVDGAALPNCDRDLLDPRDLRRSPVTSADLIAAWSRLATPEACETHLHPSCVSTRERVARLNELARRLDRPNDGRGAALKQTGPTEWLGYAASTDPDTALEVLQLADGYAKSVSGWQWDSIRDELGILLAADGTLTTAPEVTLERNAEPPFKAVHEILADSPDALRILRDRFHLRAGEETDWSRIFDTYADRADASGDWTEVWKLLRRMPRNEAEACLTSRSVCVRTQAGWGSEDEVFRLGSLASDADLEALSVETLNYLRTIALNEGWHRRDQRALGNLNIASDTETRWVRFAASDTSDTPWGKWFRSWESTWVDRYHEKLSRRPDRGLLGPEPVQMPIGWQLLVLLDGPARLRITHWLLSIIRDASPAEFSLTTFRHLTRSGTWPSEAYPHPLWSLLLAFGRFGNEGGSIGFKSLLRDDLLLRAELVPSLSAVLPLLRRLHSGGTGWRTPDNDKKIWKDWLDYAACEPCSPQQLATLYETAASAGFVPPMVATRVGPVPLKEVIVTSSLRDAILAEGAGRVSVTLEPMAAEAWIEAGAKSFSEIARIRWSSHSEDNTATLLLDLEPALLEVISPEYRDSASVILSGRVEQIIEGETKLVEWAVDSGRIIVDGEGFAKLPWPERVRLLLEGAQACGWTDGEDSLEKVLSTGTAARRRMVADQPDLPDRLQAAVGGGTRLLDLFEPEFRAELASDLRRAASVAVQMFGPAILTLPPVREALDQNGLEPPSRWGGEAAAEFVAAIGFPAEFAVPPGRKREPELSVSGPLPLKPLHDFQEDVVRRLDDLLADTVSKRRRAVISLPTGAGKTRVAAETAVTRVLRSEGSARLILWIAQTDELCEQAVQCFRELWTNLGSEGETLRIIRLWGGQVNPRPSEADEPTVVVASIQTLTSRLLDENLAWAGNPGLIVIDECHHALTPSYTGALRWLNASEPTGEREPPIIGLSATPFRGRSEDESKQLARRFDGRLIPPEQSVLFERLQDQGVLARFSYTRLEFSTPFQLTPDEQRAIETFGRFPDSALERLGENAERNDMIVEAIRSSGERSALVFATSVAHARRLAARLNMMGVTAAVVTGETDRNSRRWFIEKFHRGEVRVLCNHSALTTGFDAPATDLIVIARPVFSPSLYMQMVGRGLRGPANGGKDKCRILTVQDNLDQYTDRLAHHYFEAYYLEQS